MKGKINIAVRMNMPAHRHDARILELARELRLLINERMRNLTSERQKGRSMPERTKAKLSVSQTGKKRTVDARERMSRSHKARGAKIKSARLLAELRVNPWAGL